MNYRCIVPVIEFENVHIPNIEKDEIVELWSVGVSSTKEIVVLYRPSLFDKSENTFDTVEMGSATFGVCFEKVVE